jgi:hypothetical protein
MATNITERNKLKQELAGLGYSLKYIDEWAPKTRLYRHKASYNVEGEVMDEVGTYMDNVPGNPDYVQKKARIGLFTWKPGPECNCEWCTASLDKSDEKPGMATEACNLCNFIGEAKTAFALAPKMKSHKRKVHDVQ